MFHCELAQQCEDFEWEKGIRLCWTHWFKLELLAYGLA